MNGAAYSVVIPAHNEEGVIGRLLGSLCRSGDPEIEIVVASNGSTDATVAIAGSFPNVLVLDISEASKAAALNAGDEAATAWPRFYVDADLSVSRETLDELSKRLKHGDVSAVTARMRVGLEGASWPVRAYYLVWEVLPYAQVDRIAGVIGVSKKGRARFDRFPNAIADDLFVQSRFSADERMIVDDLDFVAQAPRTLSDLVRVKSRVYAGNRQLVDLGVIDPKASRNSVRRSLPLLLRSWRAWPALPVYASVSLAGKFKAAQARRVGGPLVWHSDRASRGG